MIQSFLQRLFGHPRMGKPELPQSAETETAEASAFKFYQTFSLRDGHLLVRELEKYELPFELEFNDGINHVNTLHGSGGEGATMTIYIEDMNREILDDLVKLHFHY